MSLFVGMCVLLFLSYCFCSFGFSSLQFANTLVLCHRAFFFSYVSLQFFLQHFFPVMCSALFLFLFLMEMRHSFLFCFLFFHFMLIAFSFHLVFNLLLEMDPNGTLIRLVSLTISLQLSLNLVGASDPLSFWGFV